MLALGNPLHAFDFDTLAGGPIVVRRARAGRGDPRRSTAAVRKLDPEDLVIADAERPVALAGIMGGEDTEVTERTTNVLLEAANFEPVGILRSSERLRLRTEGSNRWEKGVDPHLAAPAAVLATELIVELPGARWIGRRRRRRATLPEPPVVRLRPERADARDRARDPSRQEQRASSSGSASTSRDDWTVTRPDLARARRHARDRPRRGGRARSRPRGDPLHAAAAQRDVRPPHARSSGCAALVEDVLVGAGFSEAYTLSLLPRPTRDPEALRLPEPLSAEHARPAHDAPATACVAAAAPQRRRRRTRPIALFEIARVYLPSGEAAAGGALARRRDRRGRLRRAPRARSRRCYEALKLEPRLRAHRRRPSSTRARRRASRPGWVGELHPSARRRGPAPSSSTSTRCSRGVPERIVYEDVITYPALRQDLAFVVDEDVPAGELVARPRGGGARAARGARLRRLPRRAGARRAQVDRARALVPVARADALRRGRRAACASGSSRRCASASAPSCAPRRVWWNLARRRGAMVVPRQGRRECPYSRSVCGRD